MPEPPVLKTVRHNNDGHGRHGVVPVLPWTSPSVQVAKDEVLDHVTLQDRDRVGKCEKKHPTQVTLVGKLADGQRLGQADAIRAKVEHLEADPTVWMAPRSSPIATILHHDGDEPDRGKSEEKNWSRLNCAIERIEDELFWHAAERVEN